MKAQLEEDIVEQDKEVKHPKTMTRQRSTSVVASESDREVSDQHSEEDTSEEEIEITDNLELAADQTHEEEAAAAPPTTPAEASDGEPATADGNLAADAEESEPAPPLDTHPQSVSQMVTQTTQEMWHNLGLDRVELPQDICKSTLYAMLGIVVAGAIYMSSDHPH